MNNSQQSRKRLQRKRTNNPRKYTNFPHQTGEVSYTLPRNHFIMPDELITNFSWIDSTHYTMNNAGLTYATVRYRPTGVYDIDPSVLTTAVPGYTELTGIYGRYRTISSRIIVDYNNLETFPVRVFLWPSNFDLGNNYSFVASAMSAPFSKHQMISAVGGMDRCNLQSINLKSTAIVGTDEALTDSTYSSTTASIPTNNWYWNVGVWSPNNLLSSGIQMLVRIEMTVIFYERLNVTT